MAARKTAGEQTPPVDESTTTPAAGEQTPPVDDVPVFAPAAPVATTTPEVTLDPWVAENYTALVADPARNLSYEALAERADAEGERTLAAWARQKAAAQGADVTPTEVSAAGADTARGEQA